MPRSGTNAAGATGLLSILRKRLGRPEVQVTFDWQAKLAAPPALVKKLQRGIWLFAFRGRDTMRTRSNRKGRFSPSVSKRGPLTVGPYTSITFGMTKVASR